MGRSEFQHEQNCSGWGYKEDNAGKISGNFGVCRHQSSSRSTYFEIPTSIIRGASLQLLPHEVSKLAAFQWPINVS